MKQFIQKFESRKMQVLETLLYPILKERGLNEFINIVLKFIEFVLMEISEPESDVFLF